MVRSLHAAGIEVILDVVYNHTAEGNELGPTLSFRGVDNASFYRLAPDPQPLGSGPVAWSVAWFPPDQRAAAVARWPGLAEDFADSAAYSRRIERHLRELLAATGHKPTVAPLEVEALARWAEQHGYDPDTGGARSQFAGELARTGRAIRWPPARNEPCWCRSGRKYKRCCGSD